METFLARGHPEPTPKDLLFYSSQTQSRFFVALLLRMTHVAWQPDSSCACLAQLPIHRFALQLFVRPALSQLQYVNPVILVA